jgi:hypothetical protein
VTTSTLTDFVEARIADKEAAIKGRSFDLPIHFCGCYYYNYTLDVNRFCDCDEDGEASAPLLAECAAMRKIVEMFQTARPALGEWESDYASAAYDAVRALASIWSDHPQFDPAWA